MPIIVNTNTMSLNAQRYLSGNNNALGKSLEKLASGYKINRASDDAAGLQISENLRARIRGSQKANDNVQDGMSMLNIMDGALGTVTDNLQRLRELAVQAANDTNATAQRTAIDAEMDQLVADITRVTAATQFNGKALFAAANTGITIQVGAGNAESINLSTAGGSNPFLAAAATDFQANMGALAVDTNANANTTIGRIDTALDAVNTRRSAIGALTNRLASAGQNLAIGIENFSAAESRIRNVDVASESANMTRNQILQNASATVLSQANQVPSLALQLLGR